MACEFVEELRRLGTRFRSGELAFHREDVLAQPGEQFALASRDGRILRQMGMAIDKPGEDRHRAVIDPADWFRPLQPAKIIIIACFGDAAVLDNERAATLAVEGAKFRCIDQETADAKQGDVLFHRPPSRKTS